MTDNPYTTPFAVVNQASPGRLVSMIRLLSVQIVIAVIFGVIVVASVLGINVLAFLVWMALTICMARKYFVAHRKQSMITIIALQTIVMSLIIVAAILAPVKTTDRYLRRSIRLPNTEMTLGELHDLTDSDHRYGITVAATPEDSTVISFPARQLNLRQFITAIEKQSSLRHRFSHCGNGYTILWGGDCSFGLRVR
jgi:hypothetical protein